MFRNFSSFQRHSGYIEGQMTDPKQSTDITNYWNEIHSSNHHNCDCEGHNIFYPCADINPAVQMQIPSNHV